MTAAAFRKVPSRMTAQVAALCAGAWDACGPRLLSFARARARIAAASRELAALLRRADAALARAVGRAGAYLAEGDARAPGRLERFVRALLFLDPAAPRGAAPHRASCLAADAAVALAGIAVSVAGFLLVEREPLLFGRLPLLLFGLAAPAFIAHGIGALRGLSHELSERRVRPRRPRRSRSAAKKRRRALRPARARTKAA